MVLSRRALVRAPSLVLDQGLVTHIARQPVDVSLARHQWRQYVDALAGAGFAIVEAPPADACPDGVFIEDAVVVVGDLAVITRPGDARRRPEVDGLDRCLADLGYRVERIVPPATLDGGDVLKVGSTAYVGQGARTNAAGVAQLRALLAPSGLSVTAVPVTKVLHLKSAVTALPDGTVIGWPPAVDDPSVFPSFLAVPEEAGAHVVVLDERRLLMAADAPATAALLRDLGYEPVVVDIGEFVKLEGCVTCLSVRLRGPGD